MSSVPNLDNFNQTVTYIPYAKPISTDGNQVAMPPQFQNRDLLDGYELRMKAYRTAWTKCLERVQSIIHTLHTPVADAVVEQVHTAYSDVLPGLPYAELPVISLAEVATPAGGPSLLNDITRQLDDGETGDDGSSDTSRTEAIVTHLYPTECSSITSTMKLLISGFIKNSPNGENVKRRATTSLASYDIELLEAWCNAVRQEVGDDPSLLPRLIVLLHDFEQFDPAVVQDMFYICSLHIPQIPLIFLLSLSSPSSPSYLHLTYPRSTLALLRINHFTVPSGNTVLEQILLKTFFDAEFEPDIVIGPATFDFLVDYLTRHNPSADSLLTILQLTHLKHFDEPLTLLAHDSLLGTTDSRQATAKITLPSSFPFLDSLLTRLHSPGHTPTPDHSTQWRIERIPNLLLSVDSSRREFMGRARRMRVGFELMRSVRAFMLRQGYRSAESEKKGLTEMMSAALKGKLGRDVKYLGIMVKKLSSAQLSSFLDELYACFHKMPPPFRTNEENARLKIVTSMNTLSNNDANAVELAGSVGEWLIAYLQELLTNLEESNLWDIWYTGLSPFPSELINPSVRASIQSGLLNPYAYVDSDESQSRSLWELPDTCILFRRYLDSGKMINVYDWFESFVVVLESQREHLMKDKVNGTSPTRQKGKRKRKETVDDDKKEDKNEEDEERWKMEVQARFIRALHELDYLGFIKHTGRKADHVLRTVFDVPE